MQRISTPDEAPDLSDRPNNSDGDSALQNVDLLLETQQASRSDSIPHCPMTRSVGTVTVIHSFEHETGKGAGSPVSLETFSDFYGEAHELVDSSTSKQTSDNPYHPFRDETDFALANWFSRYGTFVGCWVY